MISTAKQPPGLFSTRVLLAALLAAVLIALLLFWRMGLDVRTGQAGAFVAAVLVAAGLVVEFVRRRFRLGLRSMLILVTVLCVLCAVFGNRLIRMREQQQAINRLRETGVLLIFDYQEQGDWFVTEAGLLMPGWIGNVFGESTFARIIEAAFGGSSATDEDLAAAAPALGDVSEMNLQSSMITGNGLAALSDCQRLENIALGGRQLDEESAEHLSKIKSLRHLTLGFPTITDADMAALGRLGESTNLESINLAFSGVTNAGMKDLAKLRGVKQLTLARTAVGDAGLAELKRMPHLESLNLSFAPITDAGLAHLGEMQSLTGLGLSRTAVTDAGLVHLRGSTNLKSLSLPATVSDEAAAELQTALPNCKIMKPR